MALVAELPLLLQPGTQWVYGAAYSVLGYVIEMAANHLPATFLLMRLGPTLHGYCMGV